MPKTTKDTKVEIQRTDSQNRALHLYLTLVAGELDRQGHTMQDVVKKTLWSVEKTFWSNVGTMTEFEKQDGSISRIVEIPAIGLKASVFLQEPRENAPRAPQPQPVAKKEATVQLNETYPEDKIDESDIPF